MSQVRLRINVQSAMEQLDALTLGFEKRELIAGICRGRWILIGLVVVACTTTVTYAQPPSSSVAPSQVVIDGAVEVVEKPTASQLADRSWQSRFSNSLQFLTFVFAAVAGAAAVGAWQENRRSARAAEDNVAILKAQVKSAEAEAIQEKQLALESLAKADETAKAAQHSADVARQTMLNGQRPMLVISSVDSNAETLDEFTVVGVTLRNVGLTIAMEIRLHWGFWIVDPNVERLPTEFAPHLKRSPARGPYTLAPGESLPISRHKAVGRILTPESVNNATAGSTVLYLGVDGDYRDAFGQVHRLSVCYSYNADAKAFVLWFNQST